MWYESPGPAVQGQSRGRRGLCDTIMRFKIIFILAACLSVGCATHEPHLLNVSKPATTSTARLDPSADLSLDDILPKPVLEAAEAGAATQPATTRASEKPPLDAIALFAQAREAMLSGQRYTAINLLEKAIALDPYSYELEFMLGQANTGPGMAYDPALKAFEAAAAIEPDHLAVHGELGRLYLAKGNLTRAIQQLRLAMQTQDYDDNASQAAVIDLLLAKSLEQAGYDRASLECYTRLIERLENGGIQTHGSPELAYLMSQPEGLFIEVGSLFEKRGDFEDALHLYSLAAQHKPEDFSYQAHVVHALAAAGKSDEATKRANELVQQFHASPESIALLKDTYRKTGGDDAVVRELTRLHQKNPTDRTILYALVDVLSDMHRNDQAEAMLSSALLPAHYPNDMVRRLFKMYDNTGDTDAAAALVIETLAIHPDATRDLLPLWAELLRPWKKNHLTVSRLESLDVPASAESSKQFWLSQTARIWGREVLARNALEKATSSIPAFAPAYRGLLGQYFARDDWDDAQKKKASETLIEGVEKQGNSLLAAELRGLLLLSTKQPDAAAKEFAQAIEKGDPSSDLRLSYATALQAAGDSPKAQQVLWKLIGDDSSCEDAYIELFKIYLEAQQGDQAVKVLNTWLKNEPSSINARLLEAQASPPADAKLILDDLFDREPDNLDVLASMSQLYTQIGKIDDYIVKLEAKRATHPENRAVLEQLIDIYAAKKDLGPATRALDATRSAAAQDPDLLYYVASLYGRIDQKDMTEQVLEQVLRIDPTHAAACNDLGYGWADAGKNLSHAESLIRIAVTAEPDNQSFLDSLGWVLYKLGKFEPAKKALDEAIGTSNLPDAVVLNHLGDTQYRLNQSADAAKTWKRSQDRIAASNAAGDNRDELKQLRLELQAKLKQLESGAPVSVAPTGQEPAKQAKNN